MARSSRLESGFQDRLIGTIEKRFPGCMVFKMEQPQGIPDLLVLYGKHWASLECKRAAKAKRQPNQDYYVEKMNGIDPDMPVILEHLNTDEEYITYMNYLREVLNGLY